VDVKHLLLAGLVAGAVLVPALPAHADHVGNCAFDTMSDPSPTQTLGGTERWTGVAYVYVVATDADGVPRPFAQLEVACELYVNGVLEEVAAVASGTGAVAAAGTFAFRATEFDHVEMCTRVNTILHCPSPGPFDPLEPVDDLVDVLNDAVFIPYVDPVVCPELQRQQPGIPGVLDIGWDGDVYVFGSLSWDCPPYEP
jgi:hypothetical protein